MARRLLLAVVVLALGAAPARAGDPPPRLSFSPATPLALSATAPVSVDLVNNRNEKVTPTVKLTPSGAAVFTGFKVAVEPATIPAADEATVTITRTAVAQPAPGTVNGHLTVVVGDDIARLPVSLTVAAPAAPAAKPLVAKRTVTALRWFPIGDGGATEFEIPLNGVTDEVTADALGLGRSARLGTVADSDGRPVAIRSTGELREADSGDRAVIAKTAGLEEIGRYTGKIRVPPTAETDAAAVELTVRHTDAVIFPALALLLGILLALGGQRFLGLRRRTLVLREGEGNVSASFAKLGKKVEGFDVEADFTARGEALVTAIRRLEGAGFTTLDAEAAKDVEAQLAQLRAALAGYAALPGLLGALRTAVTGAEEFRPQTPMPRVPGGELPPPFVGAAAELADGGTMTVPAFTARVAAITSATVAAAAYPAFATRVGRLWALADAIGEREDDLGERRAGRLASARGLVAGAWAAALHPAGPQPPDIAALDSQLDRAFRGLSRLTDVLGEEAPPRRDRREGVTAGLGSLDLLTLIPDEVVQLDARLATAGAGAPSPAERERAAYRTRVGWQWGLVLVAALIALVSGLDTLYFGHEFGTGRDYLAAVLWGFATKGALDVVLVLLDRVRSGVPAWLRRA